MPTTYWKCPECGTTHEVNAYELASIGTPHCPGECVEVEMEVHPHFTLKIEHSDGAENPAEGSDWKLVSFSNRHTTYEDPMNYRDDDDWNEETKTLIAKNLCFPLGYYEHGACSWFLQGQGGPGTDCRWDGVDLAGLVFLPDDIPEEQREKAAAAIVDEFTKWSNGEIYGFILADEDGEHVDSCFGFYDWEAMLDHIEIPKGAHVTIGGSYPDFADNHDFNKPQHEHTLECKKCDSTISVVVRDWDAMLADKGTPTCENCGGTLIRKDDSSQCEPDQSTLPNTHPQVGGDIYEG